MIPYAYLLMSLESTSQASRTWQAEALAPSASLGYGCSFSYDMSIAHNAPPSCRRVEGVDQAKHES